MCNPRKQELNDDQADQFTGYDDSSDAASITTSSSTATTSSVGSARVPRDSGLTEQLTEILVEDGDGDVLLQRSDGEDRLLQWLQALDMQVMGACRADERLKPLLKLNVSSGVAEDRLLAHLSEHFEPSEVGMLARCFCVPLVSIRVGKINKQGTLMCPTSIRGNLTLTVLPTSDLRLSFTGNNGHIERLFTFRSKSQCSAVSIDEIPADTSGRSFLIKIPNGRVLYFWCSEKSKLLGIELLSKMKDLLKRKPSIAELTGIRESRLGCFATHLRAYLLGSAVSSSQASSADSQGSALDCAPSLSVTAINAQYSSPSSKSLRSRHIGNQAVKANTLFQGSLSPRSSSFKEGLPKTLSSLRSAAREKLRRRGDSHISVVDNLAAASPVVADACGSDQSGNDKLGDANNCAFSSSFLESFGKLTVPLTCQVPSIGSSLFSPHYCWCPPGPSTLQDLVAPLEPPTSTTELPVLPPHSLFLSTDRPPSFLTSTPPLNVSDIPPLDFPAFLPDPLVRLPMPSSQQIPTFTPLICDPIVHIPVIDVCSSGQGYLVSAGPSISSSIPPLHPKLNPLLPETDSMVEKGARETLRLLISGSSQTNPPLLDAFPTVLANNNDKQNILVAGSRGLYSGTTDVSTIANRLSAIDLVSPFGASVGDGVLEECRIRYVLDANLDGAGRSDGEDTPTSLDEERTDSNF